MKRAPTYLLFGEGWTPPTGVTRSDIGLLGRSAGRWKPGAGRRSEKFISRPLYVTESSEPIATCSSACLQQIGYVRRSIPGLLAWYTDQTRFPPSELFSPPALQAPKELAHYSSVPRPRKLKFRIPGITSRLVAATLITDQRRGLRFQ